MKITKNTLKFFENQQKVFGTAVALENVIWELASAILMDIDVVKVNTTYKKKKKGQY